MQFDPSQFEGSRIGPYKVLSTIAHGGVGTVYRARHIHIERDVVIKVTPYQDSSTAQHFKREMRFVASLDHRHILPILDFDTAIEDKRLAYIVTPYCKDGTLAEQMRKLRHSTPTRQQVFDAAHIIDQAADALQYAHNKDIVHQNLKPSNIFMKSNSEKSGRPNIQIADFINFSIVSSPPLVVGTPGFSTPPEQITGRSIIPASNQYTLAAIAYELMTGGQVGFSADSPLAWAVHTLQTSYQPPSTFNPHIPSEVDEVILRALAKDPQQRFESITTFAEAFKQASISPYSPFKPDGSYGSGGPITQGSAYEQAPTSSPASYSPSLNLETPPPIGSPGYNPDPYTPPPLSPALTSLSASSNTQGKGLVQFFLNLRKKDTQKASTPAQKTSVPLSATTRVFLEHDDTASVGKTYTFQVSIVARLPDHFAGELLKPVWLDVLIHTSDNIEWLGEWHTRILYEAQGQQPQPLTFLFHLVAPGPSFLSASFYYERRWLKTLRFEFAASERESLNARPSGG
jgi:serine/threonine protein kinase